jgi:hypothetical protein
VAERNTPLRHFILDLLEYRLRDANPARFGELADEDRDVHSITLHVALVNANADTKLSFLGFSLVALGERLLNFECTVHSGEGARELYEQSAAHGFKLMPFEHRQNIAEKFVLFL